MQPVRSKQKVSLECPSILKGDRGTSGIDIDASDCALRMQSHGLKSMLFEIIMQFHAVNEIPLLESC